MREQVITPRAGRVGAKGRGAVSVQRPNTRKARPAASKDARQQSFELKSVLPYVPLLFKAMLAVTLGLLAYLGYRTAVSASFFKVQKVDVEGTSRASRDDIQAAVLRLSNAGVWQADLDVIAKELRELPWVRDAVVTRVLPAGMRVRVTEREPRLIAHTSGGRLVWVDDDGTTLGAATPSDEDFFIRGLEEGNGELARRENRERMEVALGLKADWDGSGLSKRVSELDLNDLRDVRVHLAGADAGTQVVLGGRDYVKRFRQALTKLDESGRVQNGQCVSYINMTTGRNAIFGLTPCGSAHAQTEAGTAATPAQDEPRESAAPSAPATAKDLKKTTTTAAARQPAKAGERKSNTQQHQTSVATRPRRAVE